MAKTNKQGNNANKTFDRKFWKIFIPFILLTLIILSFPYWFTTRSWFDIDFSETGNVGDTIGGILGPFIALGASILTFFAFWVQFKANEQQKKDLWYERFENKFYELLTLHKSNLEEMQIGERVSGRKSFVYMFYELRFIYVTSKDFYERTSERDRNFNEYKQINLINFAYKIFFYGIGVHSEKHFIKFLKKGELHLFKQVKIFFEKSIQNEYLKKFNESPNSRYFTHGLPLSQVPDDKTIEFFYFPFDGHVNRLGHYYRHLFQACKYIIEQELLTETEKYGYIKMLRAQLSNFEQLMLYYNSLAWFDIEWREIFTKYRLIKNIPIPLADFDKSPEEFYSNEIIEMRKQKIEIFEWNEEKNSN